MDLTAFFVDTYLPRLIARGVRPATIADYQAMIRDAPPSPTASEVTDWLCGLAQPAATRNRKRRYLLAVLRDARRHGLVGDWIEDVPKALESERLPRAWTVAEFSRLLSACDQLAEHYHGIHAKLWWRSFLLTVWYTGVRVLTLIDARVDEIDLGTGTLVVTSTKDRRQILYMLPPDACEAIKLIYARRVHIWPWPFTDRTKTLLRRMRRLITLAELPQLATPFHAIRRSVASYVTAYAGLSSACDALDHCRSEITRRYYVDPRIATPTRAIGNMMPRPR
jgi:integrase